MSRDSMELFSVIIELLETDYDYRADAAVPRTDERVYTYQVGTVNDKPLYVDMYAGRNTAEELVVYNMDGTNAYIKDTDEYVPLTPELTRILEEDAMWRLRDELGLYEEHKFWRNREGHGMIVALAGASASGKDTIRTELTEHRGYERIVTATTRAPRAGEKDGVDYHFMSVADFEKGIADGSIFEYRKYKSSDGVKYYGSVKQELDPHKDYVIVLDDTGIEDYQKAYGKDKVFAVLVEVPRQTRHDRAFARAFPDGAASEAAKAEFEAEWLRRTADDDFRFSEAFIARAVNYRLNNDGIPFKDVVTELQKAQAEYERAAVQKAKKHKHDKGER